ncbi:MAG TPA: NADH-quinone oxidoreductase subunit NuoE [Firmicutes bacterium]|nr:NADH-quinone oxidoreductase subunit NuoE [Bacillota bacterium]
MATEPAGSDLPEILARYPRQPGELLNVLIDLQAHYRYLPKKALKETAEYLNVPFSQVYSVATFYKALSLKPRGEHVIKVCQGTACHLRGAPAIIEELQNVLGIRPGETTSDLKFTLETVNCLGACALAPVMMIDDATYGELTASKLRNILQKV